MKTQALPINFPQSFLPDRRLLSRLLAFVLEGGKGTKREISEATGIPTGEKTGKVEPMIHYLKGMGLVEATRRSGGDWDLSLTPLGRCMATEDLYLSQSVSLWLLHLMLCRRNGLEEPASGVSDPWFALFAEGGFRLGATFDQAAFLAYLTDRHGAKGYLKGLSGLVLRSYFEASCFGPLNALSADSGDSEKSPKKYQKRAAPLENDHFPAYSAYFFLVWEALYPQHDQLSVADFFTQTRCLAVLGWERETATKWLEWMADRGLLQLDRQTGSTLALRLCRTEHVIARIYDDII